MSAIDSGVRASSGRREKGWIWAKGRRQQGGHETFMHLGTLCIRRASWASNEVKSRRLLMALFVLFMRLSLVWFLIWIALKSLIAYSDLVICTRTKGTAGCSCLLGNIIYIWINLIVVSYKIIGTTGAAAGYSSKLDSRRWVIPSTLPRTVDMTTERQMWTSPVVPVEQLFLLNSSCSATASSRRDRKRSAEEWQDEEQTGEVIFRQLHV